MTMSSRQDVLKHTQFTPSAIQPTFRQQNMLYSTLIFLKNIFNIKIFYHTRVYMYKLIIQKER